MSTSKNIYKKIPCRHFEEDGRSLTPPCFSGDSCRFLHPTDPNWPNLKTNKKLYRSAPLVPQTDLFLRSYKDEFSSTRRESDDRSSSRGPHGMKYRRKSRSPDRGRSLLNKNPTGREKPVIRGSRHSEGELSADIRARDGGKEPRRPVSKTRESIKLFSETYHKPGSAGQSKQHHARKEFSPQRRSADTISASIQGSEKVMKLFQNLASTSRETDQLSEVQKKEESKIETYKKVSATLKNITSSAENTVAPQLARSLLTQEDCKNLIEKNNGACEKIWKDAINIFAEEVTRVVDGHMQVALRSIRNEAEQAVSLVGSISKRKRDHSAIADAQGGESLQDIEDGTDLKRQKLAAANLPAKPTLKGSSKAESDQVMLIKELKLKIEEQGRAIVNLAEENNELRAALRKESPLSPSW